MYRSLVWMSFEVGLNCERGKGVFESMKYCCTSVSQYRTGMVVHRLPFILLSFGCSEHFHLEIKLRLRHSHTELTSPCPGFVVQPPASEMILLGSLSRHSERQREE